MKSLTLFITISVLFSIFQTISSNSVRTLLKTEIPCESKCLSCQQASYNLKFYSKANCVNNHCRTTCYKILEDWNKPGSVFSDFQSDSVGKCEVCFRAGYCSINECNVQKNFETAIINKVVDSSPLTGVVDKKVMNNMVQNILKGKNVNFNKVAEKVKTVVKQVAKNIQKKMVGKLVKTVNAVVVAKTPDEFNKLISNAEKHISQFSKQTNGVNLKIKKLLNTFKSLVDGLVLNLAKTNKKVLIQKKKMLKKMATTIKKLIDEAVAKFGSQVVKLEGFRTKLLVKKTQDVQNQVKRLDSVLANIKAYLKEANDAALTLKKLENMVNKI